MRLISYWVLPIISGFMWLATLLALLLYWILVDDGKPYESMQDDQKVAYISDVGASRLKPLFVAGCIVTSIFMDLSFLADRWLRHKGRLAPNISVWEKVFFGLSIFFAGVGTVGLTCLSGFDTLHYPRVHILFLILFIGGYLISAVFICAEFQRLGHKYRQHRSLTISFWVKMAFIVIEVGLLIAFGILTAEGLYDVAACLEWTISFIFSFYVFSFFIDLVPAIHTRKGVGDPYSLRPMTKQEAKELRRGGTALPSVIEDALPPPSGLTEDSRRELMDSSHGNGIGNGNPGPLGERPRDF